jgi:hypothetical protein
VENISRAPTVRPRVSERPEDAEELHQAARVPVGHDQREGVGLGGAHVREMDRLAVDGRDVLGQLIEPGFGGAPVEAVPPVLGQRFQVGDGHAPLPAAGRELLEPAGTGQTLAQVVELSLGDFDAEGRMSG